MQNKMWSAMSTKIILMALCLTYISSLCFGDQPPYQISIYINLHPQGRPLHLCNAVIVQSRVLLTTASCVHYQFVPGDPMIPLPAAILRAMLESPNALSDDIAFEIDTIDVHTEFNFNSLANDVAILRLKNPLPLGLRDDVQWIILDDDEFKYSPCLANFYVRNSMDTIPDYTQTEELPMLEPGQCANLTPFGNKRGDDLCSFYILPIGFNCEALEALIPFNGDRGTGLICNSRLVALLSTILPLEGTDNVTDCSEKPVKAYYTNLNKHLGWIYDIIANEEYDDIINNRYTPSAPYQQEPLAIIDSSAAEPPSEISELEPTTKKVVITDISELESDKHSTSSSTKFYYWSLLIVALSSLQCFL